MSNITKLYPANAADNPDNVLEQSVGQYQDVVILGYDKDGNFNFTASSSMADGGNVLWLIENFKHKLLSGDYGKTE